MNPAKYLKDYYSNSPNDNVLDQLSNFGSEAGGGKAAINGIVSGVTAPIRMVADGFTKGMGSLASTLSGKDYSKNTNKRLNDINNFFTNDSLVDSAQQNPTIDSIANYGTALVGGHVLTKAPAGLASAGMKIPSGVSSGINKVGMAADSIISNSIAHEQGKNKPLSLNNIGSSILNGVGNIIKQPVKAGVYASNAFDNMLASTDNAQKRIQKQTQNQLNSVDNFFKYN